MKHYVYLIRFTKDDYCLPHVKAFTDIDVAEKYFQNDVAFYMRQGWMVEDHYNDCSDRLVHRAEMHRRDRENPGEYEHATLYMEIYEVIEE